MKAMVKYMFLPGATNRPRFANALAPFRKRRESFLAAGWTRNPDHTTTRAHRRRRLLPAILAPLIAGVSAPAPAQPALPTIASFDVCADQLALALAVPTQIVALSVEATDPRASYLAVAARDLGLADFGIEGVIAADPDVILVGPSTSEAVRRRLQDLGYGLTEVPRVASVDEAVAQIREIAETLGQAAAGERLAQTVEAARGQARRVNWGDTALALSHGGRVFGTTSMLSGLMAVVGLNNAAADLAGNRGRVPLEVLVASPPDYLIVPEPETEAALRTDMLVHPALEAVLPARSRLEIAENLVVCGGPGLPEALRRLASELDRVGSR